MKETTDFSLGWFGPEALGKKRGIKKVIDWEKCRNIVEVSIKDPKVIRIELGLREDWGNTMDVLWKEGEFVDDDYFHAYLESVWATPIVNIETRTNEEKEVDCWIYDEEDRHSRFMPKWFKDHFGIKVEEMS